MSQKILAVFLFLTLFIAVSTQVQCYYGKTTTNNGQVIPDPLYPIQTQTCLGRYCMKIYQKNYSYKNYQYNSYGCPNGACTSTGCNENSNGYGSCCCRGDFCNSGYSTTTISSIVLSILSVFYMYF
ncbi:hypothetical protein GCK72_006142 [Caenorhabditis remanei]|uniref:Uncharacterized protein n=1 Tax=Caenorhabditis remanei TaxID=31234 RepID=A0A6A5HHN1_CAERE|nr:hypothetical protein GCK72_006142 [Caenorhabditis remanei]KAF1766186.1 hypothetical protein GCK72_006142 [Caenorhabditis remanei]